MVKIGVHFRTLAYRKIKKEVSLFWNIRKTNIRLET